MTLKSYSYKITCSGSGEALMTGIYERISSIISEQVGELLTVEMSDDETEGYPITIRKTIVDDVARGSSYIIKLVDTDTLGIRILASNEIEYWDTYNISPYFNTITGDKYFVLDFLPTSNGAIIGVYIPSSDSEILSAHGLSADMAFVASGSIFFLDCSGSMPQSSSSIPASAHFIMDTDSVNVSYASCWKNNLPVIQYADTDSAVQFVKAFDGSEYLADAYVTRIGPNPRKSGTKNNLYIAYFGDRIFYLTPLTNKDATVNEGDTTFCWAFEVKYVVDEQTDSGTDPEPEPEPEPTPEPDIDPEDEGYEPDEEEEQT